MQNVESTKSTDKKVDVYVEHTKEDIEVATENPNKIIQNKNLSDTEIKPKVKKSSKLTTAIKKLSKSSKTKKEIQQSSIESPESVISSGGEELDAIANQEQIKKKKRSLLGRFRKSKDKKSSDYKETANIESNDITSSQNNNNSKLDSTSSSINVPKTVTLSGQVEIRITAKKIEKLSSSNQAEQTKDDEYLTPYEEQTGKVNVDDTASVNNTKTSFSSSPLTPGPLKPIPTISEHIESSVNKKSSLKKPLNSSYKPTTPPQLTLSTSSLSTSAAVSGKDKASLPKQRHTEEKFVITQSSRDTPPREKAPAKPSRLSPSTVITTPSGTIRTTITPSTGNSNVSTPTTSTGAIRKTKTRASVTLSAPKIIQHFKSGGTTSSNLITKKHRDTFVKTTKSENDNVLMQKTPISPQRGHRFPKPQTVNTNDDSNKTPISATDITKSESNAQTIVDVKKKQQEQLELLTKSHESGSVQIKLADQPHKSNQSKISLPLPLPISSPSPLPSQINDSLSNTKEIQSQSQHISSSSNTVDAVVKEDPLEKGHNNESLVIRESSNSTDEIVSLAESANTIDYNIKSLSKGLELQTDITQQQQQQDNLLKVEDDKQIVQFAVGSPVRRQIIAVESLEDQCSLESLPSSENPFEELSRRRILHYVEEPYIEDEDEDEFNSLEESLSFKAKPTIRNTRINQNQMPAFGDLTMDQEMEPAIVTLNNVEKSEHLYKILVIGELGTGKTSFIKRYVHQFFSQNYRATIGVDFALKVLNWDQNTIVRLQLWDIAGQERFGNMTRVYYKEAVGAFIVFDVTRGGTFDCVTKWKEDLDSKVQLPDGSPIPCILLANKCDQEKQGIVTSPEKMDEYVKENGFAGWFETSAKENINIDEAARALVNKILLNDKLITAADLADGEKFNLDNATDQSASEKKSKCSC